MVSSMYIRIRKAKISDAVQIASIYRSDNPLVKNLIKGKMDRPEILYRFGGVWMHQYSCAEHIKLFREYGGEIFVAELNGRVIGHIEVIIDKDRKHGEYAYISVLMVHRNYRRKGIGRKLIKAAEKYARENKMDIILVAAEEQSIEFYKKVGFRIDERWSSIYVYPQQFDAQVKAISKEKAIKEILENEYDPVIGRFHGTRMLLFEFIKQYSTLKKLDIQHFFFKETTMDPNIIIGIRKSRDIPSVAWAWCGYEVDRHTILRRISGIIHYLGLSKVLTAIPYKEAMSLDTVEKITWMKKAVAKEGQCINSQRTEYK